MRVSVYLPLRFNPVAKNIPRMTDIMTELYLSVFCFNWLYWYIFDNEFSSAYKMPLFLFQFRLQGWVHYQSPGDIAGIPLI